MIEGYYEKGFCYRSDRYKLIFLHVSKNATTSIKAIEEFGFVQDNILRLSADELRAYTVFTVVRDPVKRLISGYIEVCSRATKDSLHILAYPFYWVRDPLQRFLGFLDELERGCFDVHLLSQEYFLTDYSGCPFCMDYVLDLNDLNQAFQSMQQEIGIVEAYKLQARNTSQDKLRKDGVRGFFRKLGRYVRKILAANADGLPWRYLLLDKLHKMAMHRPVPVANDIERYIAGSESLQHRVMRLTRADVDFIQTIKKA